MHVHTETYKHVTICVIQLLCIMSRFHKRSRCRGSFRQAVPDLHVRFRVRRWRALGEHVGRRGVGGGSLPLFANAAVGVGHGRNSWLVLGRPALD